MNRLRYVHCSGQFVGVAVIALCMLVSTPSAAQLTVSGKNVALLHMTFNPRGLFCSSDVFLGKLKTGLGADAMPIVIVHGIQRARFDLMNFATA